MWCAHWCCCPSTNLFKRPKVQEPSEPKANEGPEQHRPDVTKLGRKKRNKHHLHEGSRPLETSRVSRQHDFERCLDGPSRASKRRSVHLDNMHERRKRAQVRLKMEVWEWGEECRNVCFEVDLLVWYIHADRYQMRFCLRLLFLFDPFWSWKGFTMLC